MRTGAALFGLGLALAGCGFHPLYGGADRPVQAALRGVAVGPVQAPGAERTGQLIANDLEDGLAPQGTDGPARYTVALRVQETDSDVLTNAQSQVTRSRVNLVVTYTLIDAATRHAALAGLLQRSMDYDVLRINYGNVASLEDARRRLAREIANDVASRLAVWFAKKTRARG